MDKLFKIFDWSQYKMYNKKEQIIPCLDNKFRYNFMLMQEKDYKNKPPIFSCMENGATILSPMKYPIN